MLRFTRLLPKCSPLANTAPFASVPLRLFHNSHSQTNFVLSNSSAATNANAPKLPPPVGPKAFDSAYMKAFSTSELFSFMIIGVATFNKPLLNLCIRAFPYMPLSMIKAFVYKVYCGGSTFQEVRETGQRLTKRGINNMMLSLTIEACDGKDHIDPASIVQQTQQSVLDILAPHTVSVIENLGKDINLIPSGYVALKPTGLVKNAAAVLENYNKDEYKPAFDKLVANASAICQTIYDENQRLAQIYPQRTAPFVVGVIDAEKHDLQEGVYELQRRLYKLFNKVNAPVYVVGTLQMYLSGSADLLALEEKLAAENNYRVGLKLVRGAYIHSEKQRESVIHQTKEDTDINYNRGISYCIESILSNSGNESAIGHLVVASHNEESLKLATEKVYKREFSTENPNKANICLGQLLGMADGVTHELITHHKVDNVIKYVPWGPPLETKEYLLRRLEENGDAVNNDTGMALVKAAATMMFKRMFA